MVMRFYGHLLGHHGDMLTDSKTLHVTLECQLILVLPLYSRAGTCLNWKISYWLVYLPSS